MGLFKKLNEKKEYRKYMSAQRHYKRVKCRIRRIYRKNKVIKVAFLIVFKSVFPSLPIFKKMLNDPAFDPYIVILPNLSTTFKYQYDLYTDAYSYYHDLYGDRVICAYDEEHDEYVDLGDKYNVMFFANPYAVLVPPIHHVTYFIDKTVLPIYVSYGFAALKFWDEVIATPFYNYMWKCTLETQGNLEHLKRVEKIHGKNGIVTGYLKMDALADTVPNESSRKRIMICPHHTVWGSKALNIGNFVTYHELFLQLPEMFPEVDFVFRPHPLLVKNLKDYKVWSQRQIDDYLKKLEAIPNMKYDTSGDYMQAFADSDAMIHDCGSFIGEYLYTKKPCCYMMKSEEATMSGLVPLGQECMNQYYHALCKDDIINFIRDVVINGNDPKKEQREAFADNELMVNYPHAAEEFIKYLKRQFKIK